MEICTDPEIAGDMLIPTCKTGTPEIPMEVYKKVRQKWMIEKESETGHANVAFASRASK